MRAVLMIALAGCAPTDDPPVFGFLGPVENVFQAGSTIGLFDIHGAPGERVTYKFGEGDALPDEFSLEFRREPPDDALEDGQFGVAFVAMLPGEATLPDGPVTMPINQIGGSTDTAVVFKKPGAVGPAWLADFSAGFTCALCLREQQPDGFAPVDCTFVTVEGAFNNRCDW